MIHFEVHRKADDRWLLDGVFAEQATAVDDAKEQLTRARSLLSVRVLKVEAQDKGFVEWVIYNAATADPAARGKRFAPRLAYRSRAALHRARHFVRRHAHRAAVSPAVAATVLLVCGGLLIVSTHHPQPKAVWVFDRPEAQLPHAVRNPLTGELSR
jgi:hypothetical protein